MRLLDLDPAIASRGGLSRPPNPPTLTMARIHEYRTDVLDPLIPISRKQARLLDRTFDGLSEQGIDRNHIFQYLASELYRKRSNVFIQNSSEAYLQLSPLLSMASQMRTAVLFLSIQGRLIHSQVVGVDRCTHDGEFFRKRNIFHNALKCNAGGIILGENLDRLDNALLERHYFLDLIDAAKQVGLEVVDFLLISGNRYASVRQISSVLWEEGIDWYG